LEHHENGEKYALNSYMNGQPDSKTATSTKPTKRGQKRKADTDEKDEKTATTTAKRGKKKQTTTSADSSNPNGTAMQDLRVALPDFGIRTTAAKGKAKKLLDSTMTTEMPEDEEGDFVDMDS